MRKVVVFFSAVFIVVASLILIGLIELTEIETNTLEIKLQNLPLWVEKESFVHISDIHFRHFSKREKQLLEKLKEINPDYIFITGDFIDWTTRNWSSLEEFLDALVKIPKKGIYFVFGNHEHRNRRLNEFIKILDRKNIQVINNQSVFLEGVYLIGVDDPHLGFDRLNKAIENVDMKMPKILLAHSPEIFRKVNFKNVLVLAGHTHGGQINLPFISNLILPLKYDRKYKSGFFGEDYKWLYVNKGIGWTFLPFRFNAKPEIAVIKFKND